MTNRAPLGEPQVRNLSITIGNLRGPYGIVKGPGRIYSQRFLVISPIIVDLVRVERALELTAAPA
jgi:hypothetical protein